MGLIAISLGILFEKQNIAYMVGLAFAIAASTNFPVLFLSMFWRGLTTRGALIGGSLGLFTSVILVVLGPIVWVDIFGNTDPIFPSIYPAIYSISLAFLATWFFSVTDKSINAVEEKSRFDKQFVRSMTGIGAEGSNSH